jgi:aminotransferase
MAPPRARAEVLAVADDEIRVMTREAKRLGAINLAQGVGALPVLPEATAAAAAALQAGEHGYSTREGRPELRQAVAAKIRREHGREVDPDQQVVITAGAVGAYSASLAALLRPGDGILLCEPFFTFHRVPAIVAGVEVHTLRLEPPAYRLEEAALRASLRPNTRALLVCTPSNPTGHVMDEGEIDAVARVAADRDLIVFSDEVYDAYCYGQAVHRSPAAHPALRDRAVLLGSLSKVFHVTGWRIGWAVAPAPLAEGIKVTSNAQIGCAPTPLQLAAASALAAPAGYFDRLRAESAERRDLLASALLELGARPFVPAGGCFLMADVRALGFPDSRRAALALLHDAGVAAAPGSAFLQGDAGEPYLRFGFGVAPGTLAQAARSLAAVKGRLRRAGDHLDWPARR